MDSNSHTATRVGSSESAPAGHTVTLSCRRPIRVTPDSRFVYHPRFVDAQKTRLAAIVRLQDGRLTEMEVETADLRSPLRRDIFAQYTEDEILYFTERHEQTMAARSAADRRVAEDKKLFRLQEELYQAKEEAAQLLAVLLPDDAALLKRVRGASSRTEVIAWTVRAVLKAEAKG